jgi:hypothetical protein
MLWKSTTINYGNSIDFIGSVAGPHVLDSPSRDMWTSGATSFLAIIHKTHQTTSADETLVGMSVI